MTNKAGKQAYHHGNLREALLEAGIQALAEGSADELSLRKISRKLGVSHNAPYMHFKDKESLLAAIAEDGFIRLRTAVETAARSGEDWHTRFEAGCRAYIQFVRDHPAHVGVMFRPYDDRFEALRTASFSAMKILVDMISEGQEQDIIRPGSATDMAGFTWSYLHGISSLLATSGRVPHVMGDRDEESLISEYTSLALAGLARPDS